MTVGPPMAIPTSDIETMIIYVIINLFSETDVFFSEWLVKVYFS